MRKTTAGPRKAIVAAIANAAVKTGRGRILAVIPTSDGDTLDVFDDPACVANKVWSLPSTVAGRRYDLDVPMDSGIGVATFGAGTVTVEYV
ncbi:MAG TPA: hypothetical protein VFC53_01515 [Dehalococcoidia bacterium]|nr:hypothetical protein [Dehalococcoidia bacterium]